MATLATLAVNLVAQTTRFTRPLTAATRQVASFSRSAENSLKRVEQAGKRAGLSLIALQGSVMVATKLASDYANSIDKVAQQTGILHDSVQQLSYAAQQSHSDLGELSAGLRSLARRSADAARGHTTHAASFKRLGIDVRDTSGHLKDMETLLMDTADWAAQAGSEAEAAAGLMAVMGDAGRRLVPFMRQGAGGIRELMDEAVSLGIVLDTQAVRQLAAFGDQTARTQNRVGALSRLMAVEFVPALNLIDRVINNVIDGVMGMSDEAKGNAAMLATMTAAVLGLVVGLGMIAAGVGVAIRSLTMFGAIVSMAFSPLFLKLAAVGILVTLAITEFDRLVAWWANTEWGQIVEGAWTEIADVWSSDDLTLPQKVLGTVSIVATAVVDLVDSIVTWWVNASVTLAEKTVTLLGLDPDENALVGFLRSLQTVWNDSELTFGEKIVESIKLTAGGRSLVGFVNSIADVWRDEELTLPEKAVATVSLIATGVVDLLDSIATWWVNSSLTLARKTAKILGLDPEQSALIGFLISLQGIWNDSELTFGEKIVKSLNLTAGGRSLVSFVQSIVDVWNDEELTLPQKTLATVSIVADGVSNLIDSIMTWWVNSSLTLARKTAKILGLDPESSSLIGFLVSLQGIWNNSELTLGEKIVDSIELIPGAKAIAKFASDLQDTWIGEQVTLQVNAAIELGGEMYDAIKKGLDTGDWSDALVVGAEVWRTGMKITTTLALTYGTTTALLNSMAAGLGVARGLGPLGALGAISVGVALVEAMQTEEYEEFAADVITALIAGFTAGGLTGSPVAGVLVFNAALNWQLGSRLVDAFTPDIVDLEKDRGYPETTYDPLSDPVVAARMEELNAYMSEQAEERSRIAADLAEAFEGRDFAIAAPPTTWQKVKGFFGFWEPLPDQIDEVTRSIEDLDDALRFPGLGNLLDAIYVAEGGAGASVPYGTTGFRDQGHSFASAANQEIFDVLVSGFDLEPFSDEWYRASAATTVTHWWGHFRNEFLDGAEATFAELQPEVQAMFIEYLGSKYAPPSAHPLNLNWPGNVGRHLGLPGFAAGGWTGNMGTDEFAGFVHGQEIVIPEPAHRKGLAGILEFLGVPGFDDGLNQRIPGLNVETQAGLSGVEGFLSSVTDQMSGLVNLIDTGVESLLGLMEASVESLRGILPEEQFEALEERTLSLTRSMRDGWHSFKDLFHGADDLTDSFKDLQKELDDEQQRQKQQTAIASLQARILARLPILAAAMDGMEAGAAFGPAGSAIGALIAVAMETEAVGHGFRMLNEILGAGANALGMLIDPLLPLIYVLQAVLVPVFSVIGQVLEYAILPIMPALFEGLKWLGVIVLLVAEAFQWVRSAVLNAIGSFVYGLGRALRNIWRIVGLTLVEGLEDAGMSMLDAAANAAESARELGDARRDLIDLTYDEALARAKSTEELARAAGAMRNVPTGFKYALARFEAGTPTPMSAADVYGSSRGAGGSGAAAAGGAGPTVVHNHYYKFDNVYGWDDFKSKVKKANDESKLTGSLAEFGLT